MVQQLPGLVRQAGLPSGSKASASSVSGRRTPVDTRIPTTPIRPQASPVDTFRGLQSTPTAGQTEAGQVAAALAQLAPRIGSLLETLPGFGGRPDPNKERIASNRAAMLSNEQVREFVSKRGDAPSEADPKRFFGETGKRAGFDFMSRIEQDYDPSNGETKEQYVDRVTSAEMGRIAEIYKDDPNREFILEGFTKAVNPERFRIFKQEAQAEVVENRQDFKDSVQSNLLNLLNTARQPGNELKPETLRGVIDGWVKEIPTNAKLAGASKVEIAKALGQAAAHFARQGDTEMVDMIGETKLGESGSTIKAHPEFIAVFDRAKDVAISEKQKNTDKATFSFQMDLLQQARTGQLSQGRIEELRRETPDLGDPFWKRIAGTAITARASAAQDAAEANVKAQIRGGAVKAAMNGDLEKYAARFAGSDSAKYLKGIDGYVRNVLEETFKDRPVQLMEAKLQFYQANPTATKLDPTWNQDIQKALTNLNSVQEGQALPDDVETGLQTYEVLANASPWLADKYVKNEDQKMLEAVIALKETQASPTEIGTWVRQAKDGLNKGIQSQIDIRGSDFKRFISEGLDDLQVTIPGFIFDSKEKLANHKQIENKVFQIADVLAIGGRSTEEATSLAWERVKKSHALVNGVMVPTSAEQLPKDLPVTLEILSTAIWDRSTKADTGKTAGRGGGGWGVGNSALSAVVDPITSVDIQAWAKQQDPDASPEDFFWQPAQDGNVNEWQMFMWKDLGDNRVPLPLAGIKMSLEEISTAAGALSENAHSDLRKRILENSRRKRNGVQFGTDWFPGPPA